ncbi:putative clathrin-coated vesiclec protein [Microthyrium microscopicum]|uniref:Putative clathrin-coated vesiclec protein n=1 Tax=Microthyrium microscopicum TaxID=703497 RepID=A0A6A6UQG4_9PEZI|nr:putative clathrin-coated vesiclec protein [Microthyrium microscopicum]
MVAIPATPELYEEDIHTAIDARTETLQALRELGPPDLVHLTKTPVKGAPKWQGIYHHVTGIDASSSASLAAYINTLTYNANDKTTKVTSGAYCCYNAFSRLDMRVQVQIPGTVESYCIDERGEKREATDELWLETYLCGVLRAFSYADDGSGDTIKKIVGVRRFNPITSTDAEHRFFEAAERLFFNGWQLGSDPEIQVPNLVSNHLTTGLLHYINTTGRYTSGINLFEKLRSKDPEISSLLARVYIAADEEVKAVQLLHEAIEDLPMDYSLLDCQAEFLNRKGRPDLAVEIAKRAVVSAPSEFGTWARLAEIYVSLERWDLALLTLNSCPMFTWQDKDAPRMPEPLRFSLPIMDESQCDEIDDRSASEPFGGAVDPGLRKLHAASFKGTFLKAYMLLTDITTKIGWDQLLKIRSQVFVMEEEYRNEKQSIHTSHSRNPSTTALRGPSPEPKSQTNGAGHKSESDSDDEDFHADEKTLHEAAEHQADKAVEEPPASKDAGTTVLGPDGTVPDPVQPSRLQNKRLCERWLDNLFMVLYEDLRVYTIWRTEAAQYRQQQIMYKKSAEEWEILGQLAERLHHFEDAVEAWQACLQIRFSPNALRGVLKMYEKTGDVRMIIGAVIRLICWQYRWYSEFSPSLIFTVRKLIEDEGAVKVRNMVQATTLPQKVRDLTHQYASLCDAFHSSGTEG